MWKTWFLTLAAVVTLAPAGVTRADDQPRAVIDRAIQAAGGAAALAKAKAMTWKEKGTFYGMGEGIPYTANYASQYPDQFSMEVEGIFTIVVNGDKGWVKNMGGEATEMTKEQLAEQKENLYGGWVCSLLPLTDKGFTLAPLGELKVGGQAAVGVKVSHPGHGDVKLFFDKQSALLVKSEQTVKVAEEGGKPVSQEIFFKDYQDVDGVKIALKTDMLRASKKFVESQAYDLKLAGKFDGKMFAKP